MTAAYEVGDRVRVTYEGVVTGEDVVANRVHLDGGPSYVSIGAALPLRAADMTVTVLERRKPKVGDIIDTRLALGALPYDTVVLNGRGRPLTVQYDTAIEYNGVVRSLGRTPGNPPYTVVYIPA